jgi:uncharacterized protein YbcI
MMVIKMIQTQDKKESAICEGIARLQREYLGRSPREIHTYLVDDLVVIRLTGILSAAEQQLVRAAPGKGRDLLKMARTGLIEISRPHLQSLVESITAAEVLSIHHDISTATGEEVIVFTLSGVSRTCEDSEATDGARPPDHTDRKKREDLRAIKLLPSGGQQ